MPKRPASKSSNTFAHYSLKYVMLALGLVVLVAGLIVGLLFSGITQDIRQQAAGGYRSCAGGVSHGQRSCSGSRSVVMCNNGVFVPAEICLSSQQCQRGVCVRPNPSVAPSPSTIPAGTPNCTSLHPTSNSLGNDHQCQTNGKLLYECNFPYIYANGTCARSSLPVCGIGTGLFATRVSHSTPCIASSTTMYQCEPGYENRNFQCVTKNLPDCAAAVTFSSQVENAQECWNGTTSRFECRGSYAYANGKCDLTYLKQCQSGVGLFTASTANSTPCVFRNVMMYACNAGYVNRNNACVKQ